MEDMLQKKLSRHKYRHSPTSTISDLQNFPYDDYDDDIIILKGTPNFSLWEWKHRKTEVAEEYTAEQKTQLYFQKYIWQINNAFH